MNRTLLILLALCALTSAMVPRHRIERNIETCAEQTPCSWSLYKEEDKSIIIQEIPNTYCVCGEKTACVRAADDPVIHGFVNKCKSVSENS